jgi:hypothetical protein
VDAKQPLHVQFSGLAHAESHFSSEDKLVALSIYRSQTARGVPYELSRKVKENGAASHGGFRFPASFQALCGSYEAEGVPGWRTARAREEEPALSLVERGLNEEGAGWCVRPAAGCRWRRCSRNGRDDEACSGFDKASHAGHARSSVRERISRTLPTPASIWTVVRGAADEPRPQLYIGMPAGIPAFTS